MKNLHQRGLPDAGKSTSEGPGRCEKSENDRIYFDPWTDRSEPVLVRGSMVSTVKQFSILDQLLKNG